VEDGLRQRLGEAALAVARAIGYTNAGTVEFLLAPGGRFYFIEVNTRLQVEHPVTEAVTGLDLVEWQIRIAEGQDLSIQPEHRGHAVEARLYAEDPANGYAPSAGRLVEFAPSTDAARVDAGVERGDDVSVHYDGLLAKFVGWDLDRCSAIRRVAGALRRTDIAGITTNRDLLLRVLEHPQFQRGEATTAFLDEHPELRVTPPDPDGDLLAAAEVGYALLEEWSTTGVPAFFRNNPWRDAVINLDVEGRHVSLSWDPVGQMFRSAPRRPEALRRRVIRDGERYYVQGREVRRVPRFPDPQTLERRREEATTATLPGRVLKVLVTPGQQVHSGDPLVMLEAMKIEHTLRSHRDGVVEAVAVREGQMVAPGDVLVRVGDSL
jgi:acetyl/propionyl-CoA carboxylase alpha subunit